MLPRKYKLKKENDFKAVFQRGRYYQVGCLALKALAVEKETSRFAFIVSAKISKRAVERNKIKRRLEQITQLQQEKMKPGFDIVVMVQPEIKSQKYQEIKRNLIDLFKKAKLWI